MRLTDRDRAFLAIGPVGLPKPGPQRDRMLDLLPPHVAARMRSKLGGWDSFTARAAAFSRQQAATADRALAGYEAGKRRERLGELGRILDLARERQRRR